MLLGWRDLFFSIYHRFTKKKSNEFVSEDAKQLHYDPDTRIATLRDTDGKTFKPSGLPSPIMETEEPSKSNIALAVPTIGSAGIVIRKGDLVPPPTARRSSLTRAGMPGIEEKEKE